MKALTNIHRVLSATGDSTTVEDIEQTTGFDQDYIRNALLILRSRRQVVRLNEGQPRCEAGVFSITQVGRDALAGATQVEPEPPMPMVTYALSRRSQLATVWAGH